MIVRDNIVRTTVVDHKTCPQDRAQGPIGVGAQRQILHHALYGHYALAGNGVDLIWSEVSRAESVKHGTVV